MKGIQRSFGGVVLVMAVGLMLFGCGRQPPGEQGGDLPEKPPERQSAIQNDVEPPEELALLMEQESFPLETAQVGYTVQVPAGKRYSVVPAPRLERQTDQGWEDVQCNEGFCGTPDQLEGASKGFIELEWYPNRPAGTYRLSFQTWEGDEWDEEHAQYISAVFDLTE